MAHEEFATEYATKTDDDLLRLQLQSKDLTPEASAALTLELSKRAMDGKDQLRAFRDRGEPRKHQAKTTSPSIFIGRYGIGHWYLGKADRTRDPATRTERFKTTVFVLLFWFPLFPTGTYLVERQGSSFLSGQIRILQKLPLNWGQVLKVWALAAAGLLAVLCMLSRM
jgi:hypothetical protein